MKKSKIGIISGILLVNFIYASGTSYANSGLSNDTISAEIIYQDGSGSNAKLNAYVGEKDGSNNSVELDAFVATNPNIIAGYAKEGDSKSNIISVGGSDEYYTICGGVSKSGNAFSNTVILNSGDRITYVYGAIAGGEANNNTVKINTKDEVLYVYGGVAGTGANGNTITIEDGAVYNIYGGKSYSGTISNNDIEFIKGTLYGEICLGYGDSSTYNVTIKDNTLTIYEDADISNGKLKATKRINDFSSDNDVNNRLIFNSWHGDVKEIKNFDSIKLINAKWADSNIIVNITGKTNVFSGTDLAIESISGNQNINTGDKIVIIQGTGVNDIKLIENSKLMRGVSEVINVEYSRTDEKILFEVKDLSINPQTDLIAENRAVAAAFINQGTDLIADSLDVLSRDGKYGIKTFAAVHGNRSKYDVNSDLKINGWSSIVGVGNEKNIGSGDFSWGVFYENGSGNYRTYNQFNNEFFRGDGSLVYNGGGIAARFEQDNGVYTEGSLRAGMLKSEMSNALKDGAGNSYGYKSESTYYGAHIGAGKIISLNEATDLDVYGKFFHTYTDGDGFSVADDRFEFDSITSDRLRIGARLTTNKENKFSTYYGLAYEYEFNGDAQMRVKNMSTPEQSLKGSSCMAEIGMNYKPSSESPWSFDLSMRGYAGQRDGFSGNVQATYTF